MLREVFRSRRTHCAAAGARRAASFGIYHGRYATYIPLYRYAIVTIDDGTAVSPLHLPIRYRLPIR